MSATDEPTDGRPERAGRGHGLLHAARVPRAALPGRAALRRSAACEGKLIGHRCPKCGLVYAPPRGYCPIDVIETTDADEVQLADRGVVTNYTVVTPVQYYGQEETEPFAKVSIQLDEPGGSLSLQDVLEVPVDEVRVGMRVEAVWAPPDERDTRRDREPQLRAAPRAAIRGWRPTGEPDLPADQIMQAAF